MKKQGIFIGILFIGIGLFFFLQQFQLPFIDQLLAWPSILLIIGVAFLTQGSFGREYGSIFPGALLLLLGIHFHSLALFSFWPNHWAMFTAIVGLSFLFLYTKTKREGLLPAIILIVISALGLFSKDIMNLFGSVFQLIDGFWPLLLIAIGVYFIFRRK